MLVVLLEIRNFGPLAVSCILMDMYVSLRRLSAQGSIILKMLAHSFEREVIKSLTELTIIPRLTKLNVKVRYR